MKPYLDLLKEILETGEQREDRTLTGTTSVFAKSLRFDLTQGFPLVTHKAISFKNIVTELLWFISGSTNIKDLHKYNNHIWDEWADDEGYLGPIYGAQWRGTKRNTVDQFTGLVHGLLHHPTSRRHVLSSWNPLVLPLEKNPRRNPPMNRQALPPCHVLFQCFVSQQQTLSLQVYQRSADYMLGVPYNIASYALLTHLLADMLGLSVGELVWIGGDVHVYNNHLEGAKVALQRPIHQLPKLVLDGAFRLPSISSGMDINTVRKRIDDMFIDKQESAVETILAGIHGRSLAEPINMAVSV